MKCSFAALAMLAIMVATPLAAHSQAAKPASAPGTLTLTITGLRSTKGTLRIALFDATKNGKGYPADANAAKESRLVELSTVGGKGATQTTVVFPALPGGTYAVAVLHDENSNNKMDTHWYGKPKEGSGASNDPRPKTRAPRFGEAKFELPNTGKNLQVKMWYP